MRERKNTLLLFSKLPEVGKVKTRLTVLKDGIFQPEVATSFRENILSKGGTEHPMVLYKRFRGQDPTIDALLVRNGIKK